MFKFMNPATCNREIRLANIIIDKRGPLFACRYSVSFPLRDSECYLLDLLPVLGFLGTGSDSQLLAPVLIVTSLSASYIGEGELMMS